MKPEYSWLTHSYIDLYAFQILQRLISGPTGLKPLSIYPIGGTVHPVGAKCTPTCKQNGIVDGI